MKRLATILLTVLVGILIAGMLGGCGGGDATSWTVVDNAGVLQIAYGSGTDFPQYGALHLSSGYLRLVPSRTSGWGTSVVLMPALWTAGAYHQGAPIVATPTINGADLLIPFTGTIAGLQVQGQVRLSPPTQDTITAVVSVTVTGDVPLDDNRPGEAFKPVMLSSMRISPTVWDSQSAYLDAQPYPLPASGWIVQPPTLAHMFGLQGGTSTWKTNAPTIEVALDQDRQVTGWVTASNDPNNDNVGLWASADTVLPSWQYTVVAKE